MGQWDALQQDFPGIDVNQIVRSDEAIMRQPPSLWAHRTQMLLNAYPETQIDWVAMMSSYPGSAFIPWNKFVKTINDCAYSLAAGFNGIVAGAAPY